MNGSIDMISATIYSSNSKMHKAAGKSICFLRSNEEFIVDYLVICFKTLSIKPGAAQVWDDLTDTQPTDSPFFSIVSSYMIIFVIFSIFFYTATYQKAEVLFQVGRFEEALVFYHTGVKQRPDMETFHQGVRKAQEAIEVSLGGTYNL